jgi:hypothetical protein
MALLPRDGEAIETIRLGRFELPAPLPPQVLVPAVAASAVVAVVAIHSPEIALGVLIALVLGVAAWSYPEVALLAMLLLLPFNGAILSAIANNAHAHVGRLGDWKDGVIVLLFIRGLIARRDREGSLTMPRGPLPRYLIAYILIYCALALASPHYTPALTALSRDIEGPLLFLALLCLRPPLPVLRACLIAMLAAAVVLALAAVYEHFGPKDGFITWYGAPKPSPLSSFYGAHGHYRSGSFLDSPLTLGFYLAVSAPVAVGAAFAFPRLQIVGFAVAGICVAGIIMSGTRSGYIGGGVGLALVLGLAVTNRMVRRSLVGIFLILVAFAYFHNQDNPQLTRKGENKAKTSAIQGAYDYVAAHPLGAGLGTIDAVGQRFAKDTGSSRISSESTFLAKGYEGGVFALFLYPLTMLLLILYLLDMRRKAAAAGDPIRVALGAGAIGAVGAVLGAGLFLGVQELIVEVVIWGSAAFAAIWGLTAGRELTVRS